MTSGVYSYSVVQFLCSLLMKDWRLCGVWSDTLMKQLLVALSCGYANNYSKCGCWFNESHQAFLSEELGLVKLNILSKKSFSHNIKHRVLC